MGLLLLYISVTFYFLKNNKCYLLALTKERYKEEKVKIAISFTGDRINRENDFSQD